MSRLLLHQLAVDLPAETLEHLLGQLLDSKESERGEALSALAERLAALDPRRAVALGTEKKEPRIVQAGIQALLKQNAVEALKAYVQLPDALRRDDTLKGMQGGFLTPGGSHGEVLDFLKTQPKLLREIVKNDAGSRVFLRVLSAVYAKAAPADPSRVIEHMRTAASEIVAAGQDPDSRVPEIELLKQRETINRRMIDSVLQSLRNVSLQQASAFFDLLKESEKNPWSIGIEAVSRFKTTGTEAAIGFAEAQDSKATISNASAGVWWALAAEDRTAALDWIESLPQGAFRDGCLRSVMMDAWTRSGSWGDAAIAFGAAGNLKSAVSRVDYFATVLSDSHMSSPDGQSRPELIRQLPLSDGEKQELLQRTAPLKAR
jgi:hypothetical protein